MPLRKIKIEKLNLSSLKFLVTDKEWKTVTNGLVMMLGILFQFHYYNTSIIITLAFSLSFFIGFYFYKKYFFATFFLLFGFFFLGATSALYKIHTTDIYPNVYARKPVGITGTIHNIYKYKTTKIILKDLKIGKKNIVPYATFSSFKDINAKKGDIVNFTGTLFPIPYEKYLSRRIINTNILNNHIARGTVKDNFIVIKKNKNNHIIHNFFADLQEKIVTIIKKTQGEEDGKAIIITLLTGRKSEINHEILNNIREAGLAHLLAISGLHITIIAGTIFILTRKLLANNQYLTLKYDIKKISAIVAIICATFYLLLTTKTSSSVRSYIMFLAAIITILMDERVLALRIWAISFILFLFIAPQKILQASFQMSFSATFALITSFKYVNIKKIEKQSKLLGYVVKLFASSALATITIMPYELYHFSTGSITGLFCNIIAIPVTEMIVLPLSIIGILTYPFYIGKLIIIINSYFASIISILSNISHKQNLIPLITSKQIENTTLLLFTLGMFFIYSWKKRNILIGLILWCSAILFQTHSHKDMFMIIDNQVLIIKNDNGIYYDLSKKPNAFRQEKFKKELGHKIHNFNPEEDEINNMSCSSNICFYKTKNMIFEIIIDEKKLHKTKTKKMTKQAPICLISMINKVKFPKSNNTINKKELSKNGTTIFFHKNDNFEIIKIRKNFRYRIRNKKIIKKQKYN